MYSHKPKPGYWYINRTGKLMKVKMVMHGTEGPSAVLIQYVEGTCQTISINDWCRLDLVVPQYDHGEAVRGSDQLS